MVRPGSATRSKRSLAQAEVADDGVVEVLDAGEVLADVVLGPAGSELLVLGGEFADEV